VLRFTIQEKLKTSRLETPRCTSPQREHTLIAHRLQVRARRWGASTGNLNCQRSTVHQARLHEHMIEGRPRLPLMVVARLDFGILPGV
jgi:hypothetical protein